MCPTGCATPSTAADPAQRLPGTPLGHPRGHHRPVHPAGPRRQLLPEPARAPPSGRAGPAGGRPGGLCPGCLDAPGGGPRRDPRHQRRSARARSAASVPRSTPRSRPSAVAPCAGETYPYLWLDATYVKVRDGGRVVNMAALVATGVDTSGERRILGLELAAGNDEGSAWPAFIRRLVERGLSGVRLVISDAHPGLVRAVHEQLLGASWQRCRVHFTRNAQDLVPRSARGMVATVIRTVFEQPDEAARARTAAPGRRWPAGPLPEGGRAARRGRGRPAGRTSPSPRPTVPASAAPTRSSG